jgi:hypothetical protein
MPPEILIMQESLATISARMWSILLAAMIPLMMAQIASTIEDPRTALLKTSISTRLLW